MRLQGLCSTQLGDTGADGDLRALAGNSMSLCVIEPLLRRCLLSCGWSADSLPDRWGTGLAQSRLIRDAWPDGVDPDVVCDLPDFVAKHFSTTAALNARDDGGNVFPKVLDHADSDFHPDLLPASDGLMLKTMGSAYFCTDATLVAIDRWERVASKLVAAHRLTSDSLCYFAGPKWLRTAVSSVESMMVDGVLDFALFLRHGSLEPAMGQRSRDVFPVPLLDLGTVLDLGADVAHDMYGDLLLLRRVANLCLTGLNILYGERVDTFGLGRCSPQRAVQLRALHKASRWCLQLHDQCPALPEVAWRKLVHDDSGPGEDGQRPALIADKCDLLRVSGRVDPTPFIDSDAKDILGDGETLFCGSDLNHIRAGPIRRDDQAEYAKLVARQLRARKVAFHTNVKCSASVFAVGKSNGALREVWNGQDLSACAVVPPRPPHLAGVTALLDLEASAARPVRVYKRDAKCFFDQLGLAAHLQPYFGRPVLTVDDLLRHTDLTRAEIQRHCCFATDLASGTVLQPCCTTWPMGFAWSSFLAQSTLLHCLHQAGFPPSRMLADDKSPPVNLELAASLATDDVILFARCPIAEARAAVKRIDSAVDKAGIEAHRGKDVNEALNATVIGVDFYDGCLITPSAVKMALVVAGLADFLVRPAREISPLEMQTVLGHLAWFALLSRPVFSCLHKVYDFSRALTTDRIELDRDIASELALFFCLLPLIDGDLTRPWQNIIVASDASPSFGFGVSVADAAPDLSRTFSREAVRAGAFARLDRTDNYIDDKPHKPRKGRTCRLPISKSAFTTVVSSRAVFDAHAGALEAGGVQLALRWLLRSAARHGRRTVLLVDAQAVKGAVAKGRSSSLYLRREIMRIGALQLAGDLLLKLVYVPSEDNPADAPSRGIVRRRRQRLSCTVDSKRLTEKRARDLASVKKQERPHLRQLRVLRTTGRRLEAIRRYEESC